MRSNIRQALAAALAATLGHVTAVAADADTDTAEEWYQSGALGVEQNALAAETARRDSTARATNIILFVGDGMGVSTVTAARILDGQRNGDPGEENELFFENFPHLALSKVYNTNLQTPDSAGTMTAMVTGVKTQAGVIGVGPDVIRGNCASMSGNELRTALEYAELIGMATGIVTTTRVTHATPASTYAKSVERGYEDDRDASWGIDDDPAECPDIAAQLVDFADHWQAEGYYWVDGLEVALGGGRRSFLPRDTDDVDGDEDTSECLVDGGDDNTRCERVDGRNLTQEWLDSHANAVYVHDQAGFDEVSPWTTTRLLGLFEDSHLEYNHDRGTDTGGEPSLTEMTEKAIAILSKDPQGFFLHVESGRIDHAHHATNPYRALDDTIEFANAVRAAYRATDPERTLILVTADHSHVFTIAGYPARGNPILGKVVSIDGMGMTNTEPSAASDGTPYTTLGYTNGRGFIELPGANTADAIYYLSATGSGRADLTAVDTEHEGFHSEVLVPLTAETHAGEDVAIYATGPGSSLVNGLMEQHEIYHVMNRAGRLEARAEQRVQLSLARVLQTGGTID